MAHLHLGTRDVEQLVEILPARSVFHDGDDWEVWGEKIPSGEARAVEHVVVAGDATALLADVAWILAYAPSVLEVMEQEHQKDTLAVITAQADWSDQYYVILSKD